VFADVERVSATEGDSVTLQTGVTEIQRDDVIEWRLNVKRIAEISDGSISTDVAFRDGMQLDRQTGDLTITNIRTTDSGEYKLQISLPTGSSKKIFNVTGECLSFLYITPCFVFIQNTQCFVTDVKCYLQTIIYTKNLSFKLAIYINFCGCV